MMIAKVVAFLFLSLFPGQVPATVHYQITGNIRGCYLEDMKATTDDGQYVEVADITCNGEPAITGIFYNTEDGAGGRVFPGSGKPDPEYPEGR